MDGVADAVRTFDAPGQAGGGEVTRLSSSANRDWQVRELDEAGGMVWLVYRGGMGFRTDVVLKAYPAGEGRSYLKGWSQPRMLGRPEARLRELMQLMGAYWRDRGVEAEPGSSPATGIPVGASPEGSPF